MLPPAPNPTRGAAELAFTLPGSGVRPVRLRLYDVHGRLVRVLIEGPLPAGSHRLPWDGRDQVGRRVASGVYFLRLETGRAHTLQKITMMR
jgi:flagellar hook assembly protein FlgD